MNVVQFKLEKKYINAFIRFPQMLYPKDNMESAEETKALLEEKHPLSKYFKLYKFLIYQDKKVVGRFAITVYPEDDTAYLGFFECVKDSHVAKLIFDTARAFAKDNQFKKIVGPVDASFWMKYRLKINMFDQLPYTGEPYNKDYYYQMFLDNHYKVIEHYTSNVYQTINEDYENEKYSGRYQEFLKQGYEIKSPNMNDFEKDLKEVYRLLTKLYSDFPIYKPLSEKDFVDTFQHYQKVMNPEMIKFAYYQNQMVGFYISIPNYHNMVYHLNLVNLIKVLKLKKKPKGYVMLYMGVDEAHRGLGKAIVYSIMLELQHSKLPSIGALARDGKITQNYVEELINNRYEYVLLEDGLEDENK